MELVTFGSLLRQYRMASGLTQEALADRANLSSRAISDLERGINRVPRYDTLNMLAGALDLSPEQRASLFGAARPRPAPHAGSAQETPVRPMHVLPSPPTALIGREGELAYGLKLLREHGVHLLTVTGPGGVGKTRLALQIALELRPHFPDGLVYVDLTPVSEATLVPQAVAQALGLREEPGSAFPEQARAFLQGRRFLLVLDNFEQVLEAAQFLATLLADCPHLHILVTSRVPLRLRAEHQLVLAPLALKDASVLFRERAQAHGLQFVLDDVLPVIEAICEQVDRLPLAIELAAAHVRVLSLPLLLERLEDRLSLLHGGARDLPERQRAMHEAIAWSYNLLDAAGQRTFRALGVFAGGFTLDAAEVVCTGEETGASTGTVSTIEALIDAALVQSGTEGAGTPRYNMLELIREFALEQLRTSGEYEEYSRRHARYYARLAEEVEHFEPGHRPREAQLKQESSNGRTALRWAYERGEVETGLRLATGFGQFWFRYGQAREAGLWLERMLELDAASLKAAPLSIRGRALHAASRQAMSAGQNERAEALAKEAVVLAEQTGDQADISRALAVLGSIAWASGRENEAVAYFTDSYAAAQRAGEARAQALALLNLGEIARKRGEFQSASAFLEESLAIVRASGMTWAIADTVTLLGHLARQQEDYERARLLYRESAHLYRTLADSTHIPWCLEGIAALACAEQHYEHATRLCAAAAALRASSHTPIPLAEQDDVDKTVMTARAALREAIFVREWRTGSIFTQDDAISYALTALSE